MSPIQTLFSDFKGTVLYIPKRKKSLDFVEPYVPFYMCSFRGELPDIENCYCSFHFIVNYIGPIYVLISFTVPEGPT